VETNVGTVTSLIFS